MSDETKKILLNVEIKANDAIKAMADIKERVSTLRKEQKLLDTSTAEGKEQFQILGQQIKALNAESKAYEKQIQTNVKAQNEQAGSIQALKAQLSLETAAYNKLSEAERNAANGQKMQASIKATSDELKKLEKELGDSHRVFGEYERGMGGVSNTMTQLPGAAGSVTKSFLETGKSMWALVANPVGAVLLAIFAALYGLYSLFKDFKPVVDMVEQSMAALGAVFQVVKNTIIGLFTGQKSLIESTKGLGAAMSNAAKDAIELKKAQQELEDSQASLEVQNKRAETQMQKLLLQSKNRTLSEKERIVLIDKAMKIETDIHNRKLKQSNEEVKIAENKIIVGKNLTAKEIERLKREGVAYARILQDKKGITDEEIENLKDALLKREDINQESISLQEKAQNRRDALADKAQADEEKRQAKAIQDAEKAIAASEKRQEKELKSMQTILDLKIKKQKDFNLEMLKSDTYYNDRIDMINSNWNDEKKIIDKELQYKKINAEEAALKYIDAETKKNDSIKSLNQAKLNQIVSSLQYELQLKRSHDDEIISLSKLTAEKQHLNELLRIQEDRDVQLKEQDAKLAADPEYQAEYDRQVELIRQKGRTATTQANAAWEEKERQRKLSTAQTDLNNELAILQGNIDREYELKLKGLEAQKAAELLAAEETGANVALINEKYAKLETDLDNERTQKKFQSIRQYADDAMGILTNINNFQKQIEAGELQEAEEKNKEEIELLDKRLKTGFISQKQHDDLVANSAEKLDNKKRKIAHDQAVREKELNIFKAIINTASAVVAALPNVALSILAGVTGAVELATIIATPIPKASRGLLLKGKSHAQGGIPIEAEGGEAIINKRSTAMFKPILSAINEAGGGVRFENGGIVRSAYAYNDGGFSSRSSNSNNLSKKDIEDAMSSAIAKMKPQRIAIEDFRKADANYTKVEDRANF